jgi:two-component system, NarL family, response regulator LiaR
MERVRLILVDDHAIVRQGLRMMLEAHPQVVIVAEAENADEALVQCASHMPDIVLLDLLMPGLDAIKTIPLLLQQNPILKILILSSSVEDQRIQQALKAGAHGYILKASRPVDLIYAIEQVQRGFTALDPALNHLLMRQLQTDDPLTLLTAREREVFNEMALGQTNAQIALRLGVSEGTVRTHVVNVLDKLDLRDRSQASIYALKRGLIRLDDLL